MLYAIIAEDHPNSLPLRQSARPDHLKRLQILQEKGALIIAGPHPSVDSNDPGDAGFSGSLIIAEFASLEAAQSWAAADPYVTAGVYNNITVKPFKKVFPA